MNHAEYDHFHAYQDYKDAVEKKLAARSAVLLKDLWQDQGSLVEALKEGLSESDTFVRLLIASHQTQDHAFIGQAMMALINDYLSNMADELAESELP